MKGFQEKNGSVVICVGLVASRKTFDFDRLKKLIVFQKDSKTREELTSPYNFVPFYLPQLYGDVDRIVYLDTDIVVQVRHASWEITNVVTVSGRHL